MTPPPSWVPPHFSDGKTDAEAPAQENTPSILCHNQEEGGVLKVQVWRRGGVCPWGPRHALALALGVRCSPASPSDPGPAQGWEALGILPVLGDGCCIYRA